MSLTFNKVNSFVADLANKVHNFGSDQFAVCLTDTAPTASSTSVVGEISYANFSGTNPNYLTVTSSTQTGGTYKWIVTSPFVMTASGTVPQFRYGVLKNITANKIIGYFDYGSEINMTITQTATFTFDGTNGVINII